MLAISSTQGGIPSKQVLDRNAPFGFRWTSNEYELHGIDLSQTRY